MIMLKSEYTKIFLMRSLLSLGACLSDLESSRITVHARIPQCEC